MSQSRTLCSGMDVHKDAIAVAYVAQDHGAAVLSLGSIGTRQGAIDQMLRKRPSNAKHRIFVYDAGPCGSWLSRSLTKKGDACWGVAPSLMPKQPGERVKTDRRDAVQLARLARAGELTAVYVPKVAAAAIRDLTRARDDTISACQDAPLRLKACWRRHDIRDVGRAHWRPPHRRGLSEVVCPPPAHPIVLQAYVRTVNEHTARLQRLAQELHAHVNAWRWSPVVEALQALRGVQCPVAVTLVAAMGDLTRFERPRALMKFLGLIPAEYSSGAQRRQGAIPQAGNTHARRVLVEGAWAYRSPAKVSQHVPLRLATQPKVMQDIRWKAPVRRCTRSRRLVARGKHANVVTVAMARALTGFLWAMAQEVPVTPEDHDGSRWHTAPRNVQCGKVPTGIGRAAAPVWCHPRQREEARTGHSRLEKRQAPDGRKEGGSQPTDISRINRRLLLAPALPMHRGKKTA